jgi:hypothetical protein
MRNRNTIVMLVAALAILFGVVSAQAMTTLGRHPFYKPPLTSVADFQQMVTAQQGDIQKGFEIAGIGPVFESFMAQIGSADITQVEYYKGQRFQWMFYRRNGEGPVRIDKTVLWESDTPFSGYEFYIDHDGSRYTFSVPVVCANIALKDVGETPAPPPPPPPPPAAKPEAKPEPAPEPVAAAPVRPYQWILDVGYLNQVDPAHYLLFRGGIKYPFHENWSVLGLLGVAPKVDGDVGETAFLADFLVNYDYQKFFAAAGLGAWLTGGDSDIDSEDNDLDLILEIGYQLYEKPEKFTLDGFIEARSAVDELGDYDQYGRLGFGVRFGF